MRKENYQDYFKQAHFLADGVNNIGIGCVELNKRANCIEAENQAFSH
jgi:hypothetical protein